MAHVAPATTPIAQPRFEKFVMPPYKCEIMMRLYSLAIAAVVLAGCASGPPASSMEKALTGTLTYREKFSLPRGARVHLTLVEASPSDKGTAPVAQAGFRPQTGIPIAFRLPYSEAKISPDRGYLLLVQVTANGRMWFSNLLTPQRVITQGAPTQDVEILLRSELRGL